MKIARNVLLSGLFLAGFSISELAWAEEDAYIQVQSTQLRAQPKHWANPLGALTYGTAVKKISESDGWVAIRSGSKTGYLHESALSEKKIVLRSSGSTAAGRVDSSDVVLAGKGFSKEVEKSFAATNSGANFSAVNQMERIKVSDSTVLAFMRDGKLIK